MHQNEENFDLQTRSAVAVASFVEFCTKNSISQPPDKIVKNLCTFLCQDIEQTPTFALSGKITDGILSFQIAMKEKPSTVHKNGKDSGKDKADVPDTEESNKTRLARRGAGLAFNQLSTKFGGELFEAIPAMWPSMAGGLESTFRTGGRGSVETSAADSYPDSPSDADALMEKQFGQDVIDSLSVLEAIVPSLHQDLWPKLAKTYPMMHLALRSRFAIIRQSAARCFATVCDVVTSQAMRFVIENVLPLLGDPLSLANRQGAAELIYRM